MVSTLMCSKMMMMRRRRVALVLAAHHHRAACPHSAMICTFSCSFYLQLALLLKITHYFSGFGSTFFDLHVLFKMIYF